MKIGKTDIKSAYLGKCELTHANAFLGTVPLIDDLEEAHIETIDNTEQDNTE